MSIGSEMIASAVSPSLSLYVRRHLAGVETDYMVGGQVFSEYRLRDAAGNMTWYCDSMTVLSDISGRPLTACGIAVDVTLQREQEKALRDSEEKYRATMDAAQVGVFILQDY